MATTASKAASLSMAAVTRSSCTLSLSQDRQKKPKQQLEPGLTGNDPLAGPNWCEVALEQLESAEICHGVQWSAAQRSAATAKRSQ